MLAKVIIENGVKKIQALTADTGTGAPVGSYLYLEKKSNPQGYLYCDGSTFDETAYPALYQYLGTNVLPDWREFSAVGAEQNTTSSVIATHDVFTQGEEKDDQLQNITGNFETANRNRVPNTSGVFAVEEGSENWFALDLQVTLPTIVKFNASRVARAGTVTRGKSRAVFIYIKATSGLTENQQENVLNTINENNSYSTEEHPTGKKWIDGKTIYRKVVDFGALPNNGTKHVAHNIANIDNITDISIIAKNTSEFLIIATGKNSVTDFYAWVTSTGINIHTDSNRTSYSAYVTVEYTKTNG